MKDKTYKARLRKAMDLIMFNSTSKFLAVAAVAKDAKEAAKMIEYINNNL